MQANAHAPYSRFRVGAAVRTASGRVFAGCNVENAAYPQGSCAEAGAISAMVAAGEHEIVAVLTVCDGEAIGTCCGGCRQRLREFAAVTLRSTPLDPKVFGRPSHWTSCFRTRSAPNTSASSNNEDGENMIHKRMSIAIGSAALLAFIAPACSSDSKNNSTTTMSPAHQPFLSAYTAIQLRAGGSQLLTAGSRADDLGQSISPRRR